MKDNKFLRYDDAAWNVSGLFVHDRAILFFYDLMQSCGFKLNLTVHGNMPCKWNSGRVVKSVDEKYQKWCLEQYAVRNIPVLLTFSNYTLTERDLEDRPSNRILEWISYKGGNGVIIASPILTRYIHQKYPHLLLCSSILKVVHEHRKGDADYYNKLTEKFDRVVLHPDDGFNIDFIEKLERKEKIEVLINENCVRNCMFREEHCDIVCEYYQQERRNKCFEKLNKFKREKCLSMQDIVSLKQFLQGKRDTCNMTYEELEKVYERGFRFFKVQGRSLSTSSMIYDLIRYITVGERSAILYKMIMDRICTELSEVGDKRRLSILYDEWERI